MNVEGLPAIAAARLKWRGDQPVSAEFGDIYHAADGIAEVNRVFLNPVRFAERCRDAAAGTLTIGEIGFGTGLNFVTFAERFLAAQQPAARLHFVSFEARPIDTAEFSRLAERRARVQPAYRELAAAYPPLLPGWHRLTLRGGRIRLSLYFGDAAAGLADLIGRPPVPMDAWLLDGFDPRRNVDCWSESVFAAIGTLSGPGTRVATFSVAGAVRRGLAAHGFEVARIDQRPHKRHTLAGVYTGVFAARSPRSRVVVVGAGLAGVCTSSSLATAGIETILVDRDPEAAMDLPGTVLHTRLLAEHSPASRMRRSAYLCAARFYRALGFAATGALQFTGPNLDRSRLERIAQTFTATGNFLNSVDAVTASSIAGVRLREPGLHFPDSHIVDGKAVAQRVRDQAPIVLVKGTLLRIESLGTTVRAHLEDRSFDADAIVLCTGCPPPLPQTAALEVLPVWGQLEVATMDARLHVPLFADGYLCPLGARMFAIGATYEQRPWAAARATAFNIDRANGAWRRLAGTDLSPAWQRMARGSRAISSDRLPVVGALSAPGVYVNLAHGSNGTATGPLGAAVITELMGGDFAQVTRAEMAVIAPDRFAARQQRRGPRHGAR